MIGDRILADTVMGNSYGYFTIDTQPFSTAKENFMVKLMRRVETSFLPLISPSEPPSHPVLQRLKSNN
jgi:predicted HAD superfamily phosphohydrolase YqeG